MLVTVITVKHFYRILKKEKKMKMMWRSMRSFYQRKNKETF